MAPLFLGDLLVKVNSLLQLCMHCLSMAARLMSAWGVLLHGKCGSRVIGS